MINAELGKKQILLEHLQIHIRRRSEGYKTASYSVTINFGHPSTQPSSLAADKVSNRLHDNCNSNLQNSVDGESTVAHFRGHRANHRFIQALTGRTLRSADRPIA